VAEPDEVLHLDPQVQPAGELVVGCVGDGAPVGAPLLYGGSLAGPALSLTVEVGGVRLGSIMAVIATSSPPAQPWQPSVLLDSRLP
jgi:hypothetical protein